MGRRFKLRDITASQVNALLAQHNYSVPATANTLGVTPQSLNRWLRENGCTRVIKIECVNERVLQEQQRE